MRGKTTQPTEGIKKRDFPSCPWLGNSMLLLHGVRVGSVLARGTKTSNATWHSQKNKIEKKKIKSREKNGTNSTK